jgi:aryl-alcohol dehydrogenase-like predicted oxidoreductase
MHYRRLGRSGLLVSPLCLGTMTFGGPTSPVDALAIIAKAGQAGVNFIDTADVYQQGRSEEIVGAALKGTRDQWVVATKVGNAMGEAPNRRGLSRKWIMQAIDASLGRLATDFVDIYYLHREDHDTPLDETVRAIGDLVRSGKIRYFGLSNFRAWRVAEICNLCDRLGLDRPIVSQPYYNAMNRMPEVEHLPACGYYGLGVVPYSPLARGILTGKYQAGRPAPNESRLARQDPRLLQTEWREESLEYARIIQDHAQARGQTAGQFAVNWVLNNRLVTALVAGPRTIEQWDGYVSALEHAFTAEDEALVNRLVAAGHPSTPGYTDPAYPLEGRQPRTEGG